MSDRGVSLEEFRALMGRHADGRSDEELAAWKMFLEWLAEAAVERAFEQGASERLAAERRSA